LIDPDPQLPVHTLPAVVAVVDDDPDILDLVSLHLTKAGMKVKGFADAEQFYRGLRKEVPDLVILDLMLPDSDGLEICRHLRGDKGFSVIPIIMVTAKADEIDRVLGLEMGADDYITKPFSTKELIARVRAVLRRGRPKNQDQNFERIEIDGLVIDVGRHEVLVGGVPADLTAVEFRIMNLLS
jgi:DNA-binding response OmpR family regulator